MFDLVCWRRCEKKRQHGTVAKKREDGRAEAEGLVGSNLAIYGEEAIKVMY
jgi:hypothetical protein